MEKNRILKTGFGALAQSVEHLTFNQVVGGSNPPCFTPKRPEESGLFFVMGFILLRVLEFFVFRKMEMPETKNHLLCGWRQSVEQKNHLSVTIELFRHYCKKGKVILW